MTSPIYTLQPEHRARFPEWRNKWIANALRTGLLTPEERTRVTQAIKGLYAAADLKEPRVIFVPSPFVGAFASGFAAGVWYLRGNKIPATTDAATEAATRDATDAATLAATRAATFAATLAATRAATYAATLAATLAATHDATGAATRAATDAATRAATDAATFAATDAATLDATRAATRAATDAATRAATRAATLAATFAAIDAATLAATFAAIDAATNWYSLGGTSPPDLRYLASQFGPTDFLLRCASNHYDLLNGGNQWSGWVAYLSFFRHIVGLKLDYSKWDHYEVAATAGPRYMHPEFCLVSEPPLELKIDDQNRPHCDDGPFCRWADGSRLYSIHGVRVPEWIVEHPEAITLEKIRAETNAEIKRIMRERYGESRYLRDIGARVIDIDTLPVERDNPEAATIVRALMEDDEGRRFLVGSDGSTDRTYYMEVDARVQTCREAHAFLSGFSEEQIIAQS